MSHDCDCDSCRESDSRWSYQRSIDRALKEDCPRGKHTAEMWRCGRSDGKDWAEYRCFACKIYVSKKGKPVEKKLCPIHPRYKGFRKPRASCFDCWHGYFNGQRKSV